MRGIMSNLKVLVSNYLMNHSIHALKCKESDILSDINSQKDFQIFLLTELMITKGVHYLNAFNFISLTLNDDTISSELKNKVKYYYKIMADYNF